jgi:hypothetical protein
MGRPKVNEESRRAINFTIRLTTDEQKRLEKAAEICGKTPAVVVRAKLFKGKFPAAKIPRIELNTYLELKKIGTNLNQLTRLANAGKISKFFNQVLMQLMKQQQTIIDQIIHHDSDSENR